MVVSDIDIVRDLPFVVIGLAPKNQVWGAFAKLEDAEQFARRVPYGRVCKVAYVPEDDDVEQR